MFKSLASAALLALAAIPAQARYSELYVFGDSLVDAGNVDILTARAGLPDPSPGALGYAPGRFTNGWTLADVLHDRLIGGPSAPSLAGGTNFGFGGALAVDNGDLIPDLAAQVRLFAATLRGPADPGALYLINVGGNDGFAILGGAPITPEAVGAAIAGAVSDLVALGARRIVVNNVVDLGLTPITGGARAATEVSEDIDDRLAESIDALGLPSDGASFADGSDEARVRLFDALSLSRAFDADPGAFGLPGLDPDTTCLRAGTAPACPGLKFFDPVHPTAVVHDVFGRAILQAVPAPATLALFGLGLLGLAAARRCA